MLIDRRTLLGGGTLAVASAFAQPAAARAAVSTAAISNIEMSASQREFLGAGFVENLGRLTPNARMTFIEKDTFALLHTFLKTTPNPLGNEKASDDKKEEFALQLRGVLRRITRDKPLLAEFLGDFVTEDNIENINISEEQLFTLLAECLNYSSAAKDGRYATIPKISQRDLFLMVVPSTDFKIDIDMAKMFGVDTEYIDKTHIVGTDRDGARLVALHEVGHVEEFWSRPLLTADTPERQGCQIALNSLDGERHADRLITEHFVPEQGGDATKQKIIDCFRMARAFRLYTEATTNAYRDGEASWFNIHATAFDLHPERQVTAIDGVELLGANTSAASFIRATSMLVSLHRNATPFDNLFGPNVGGTVFLEITSLNAPPRELIALGSAMPVDRGTYAAIGEALCERGAFEMMPLAKEAVLMYVEAIKLFAPRLIEEMPEGQSYNFVKKVVADLPDRVINGLASHIYNAAQPRNFCQPATIVQQSP